MLNTWVAILPDIKKEFVSSWINKQLANIYLCFITSIKFANI